MRGPAGLEAEDNGRKIEYSDHEPKQWRCGECGHEATSLDELVRGVRLVVGARVVLPHGTVGEIEAFLDRDREHEPKAIVGGVEYESWELDELPEPTADQLALAVG